MSGIFCDQCGTRLDEAPRLLPDQRPPCPACGSQGRRFEQTVPIGQAVETETALPITPLKSRTIGSATIVHAGVAEGSGEALPPTIEARSGSAVGQARVEGRASGVRLPRRVTDQLVVIGRLLEWTPLTGHLVGMSKSIWWVQLSEQPTWLVLVVDEAGELIGGGIELENDQIDAFVGVAKDLLPSGAGPTLLTIRDQAGEKIAGGLGYDSIKGLAAMAEYLLPRHPG